MFDRFRNQGYEKAKKDYKKEIAIGMEILDKEEASKFRVRHGTKVKDRNGIIWTADMIAKEGDLCNFSRKCRECGSEKNETFKIGHHKIMKVRKS